MKNKIAHKFQRMRIQQQIFYSIVLIVLFGIIFLGGIIYHLSKNTIQNNYKNSHLYNLQVSSNNIDTELKYIVEVGRTLLENKEFLNIMGNEKSESSYFSIENQIKIDNILSDTTAHNTLIDGMTVITEGGNWRYFSKRNSNSGLTHHFYTTDNILEEDWIEDAKQAKGKEVFFGYHVMIPEEDSDTISYVKNLINPATRESVGVLVVVIRKSLFMQAFGYGREGYQTNQYMIVDKDDEMPLIYLNGNAEDKEDILNAYLNGEDDNKYLFSSYHNPLTDWMIINVIEKKELSRDSAYIGWVILVCCGMLLIGCFLISKQVSTRISNPLRILEKTIEDVGEGNRNIQESFDESEVGVIGQKFKMMVNNNLELRERLLNSELKEREAELLLLQAQINPHFLYNTLDSLYFMAVIKEDDEFADMVMALSNTFKLSLNKGKKFITVHDEVLRMKEYMKIQNMRYKNRFQFYLEIDEEIEYLKILTFILQPFVENAMYHGLEAKIGGGYIKVTGKRENDILYFTIGDNGVGIENIAELDNGYGVRNVKERIQLVYGKDYGVSFVSEIQVGTTVTIVIPVKEE